MVGAQAHDVAGRPILCDGHVYGSEPPKGRLFGSVIVTRRERTGAGPVSAGAATRGHWTGRHTWRTKLHTDLREG